MNEWWTNGWLFGDIGKAILQFVAKIFTYLFSMILDLIFGLLSPMTIPDFSIFSSYLTRFWDLLFDFIGVFRSTFLLGTFEMRIIFLILTIKLVYKPAISIIKYFIKWWDMLKK